eukprot:SAG31_NODE_1864_length_7036_cov_3.477584_2_plen_155_part_00
MMAQFSCSPLASKTQQGHIEPRNESAKCNPLRSQNSYQFRPGERTDTRRLDSLSHPIASSVNCTCLVVNVFIQEQTRTNEECEEKRSEVCHKGRPVRVGSAVDDSRTALCTCSVVAVPHSNTHGQKARLQDKARRAEAKARQACASDTKSPVFL